MHASGNALRPFEAIRKPGRAILPKPTCATSQDASNRRDILLATGGALLLSAGGQLSAPQAAYSETDPDKRLIKVQYLSAIAKNSQKQAFKARTQKEFRKGLAAEDAPACLRLVLHDAATYDVETGTGGLNGSIVLPQELDRPENKGLKPTVDKLRKIKNAIDEGSKKYGIPPISWSDTLVLGAKISAELSWVDAKKRRLGPGADIETISAAFGADFPVNLGRVDASGPDPAGRFPDLYTASPQEVQGFLSTLGTKAGSTGGLFAPKPLFWERPAFVIWTAAQPDPAKAEQAWADANDTYKGLKLKYDRSRDTVTRTDYEVDFIDFFTRLTRLGPKLNPDFYLVDQEIAVPKL
ncbi:g4879 [Coccomyxa viridis]|uniref:G4879 protein n=1 Tax=Coccomyxa viridis TaxID=1274662 RepID=A0ABP1FRD3_9CHLO